MMKPCPACRTLVPASEWIAHQQQHRNEGKGSAESRGYDAAHRALRKKWAPKVKAGIVDCARCGERIAKDESWELDHTDDRTGYLGPSHTRCNRATMTHRASRA